MELKVSRHQSIILLSLQIVNHLLKRGFVIACVVHPVLSIHVLNILLSQAVHEGLHLGLSRRFNRNFEGKVFLQKGTLSVFTKLTNSTLKNAIICFSPGVLGILTLVIKLKTSIHMMIAVPWILNSLSLLPFSVDFRTFLRDGIVH